MDTTQISRFLLELGRLSAQAGVLVLAVLVVQRVFRKQLGPRWCCALWMLVALRLAVPFSFTSVTSIFNLLPDWPRAHSEAPAPQVVHEVSFVEIPRTPMALRGNSEPLIPEQPAKVIAQPAPRWPLWVLVAWLAGVCVLAAQVVVSSVRFWSRNKNWQRPADPAAIEELEKCCERLRVRTKLELLESAEVESPGLCGLWRPRLLLPKGFTARFSAEELQFVFLHELAHWKRRDLLMNWVITVLQITHWFNPLVWLGFSRWRTDREMACDAMALEAAGEDRHQEYGRTILRLLEHFAHPTSTPGVVGILEDRRQMHRRINMIAGYVPTKRWPVMALALAAGLAAIGLTDARNQRGNDPAAVNSSQEKDNNMSVSNHLARAAGIAMVALTSTSAATGQSRTADELIGAWVLVGTPDKIEKAPAAGGRMKFFTGQSFCVTQADPKTGVVVFHHGGTYAVSGDEYVEAVSYANPTTMNFIGGTNGHFNVKIDGDTMTLIGIGNPWKEVWKRADKPASSAPQTAKDLIGVWAYAGSADGDGKVPAKNIGFKFITADYWCDTQADSKTGIVVAHHGGTWSFQGGNYVESVKYANPGTLPFIGHDFKFISKVDGDTLTLKGIENPWNEIWKRVK